MNDQQFSLFELQQQVKSCLDDSFALPVWVKAEISEMTVNRSGHCYLDLIETEPNSDTVVARCRATIWSYTFRMLKPYFETTTGQSFSEGIKVLLQAKIEYHEVYGISLNIRDIDPVYTLGDLARQRQEIIRRLKDDGVFDMNKDLELPVVPQRIAVISSPTAAGLQDFLDQLHQNQHQFIFYTKLFPAIMQGNEAPRSIMAALEQIFTYEDWFDAVVIIRGGGSQLDLACFDQYELAFHVAQFPLPVITGIGHDKDDSVVDLVAHTRLKTPTAVAEFLISGALAFAQELAELEKHFTELITDQLEENRNRLNNAADRLNDLVSEMIQSQQNRLMLASVHLANRSELFMNKQQNELRQLISDTRNKTRQLVANQNHQIERSVNQLKFGIREQVFRSNNRLKQFQYFSQIRTHELLRAEKKNLNVIQEKLRLVDPQNILKRGFSLTLVNGKIVKSVTQIQTGDQLKTQLSDGAIESTAEKIIHKR